MGANTVKIRSKPPMPIRATVLKPTVVLTFSSELSCQDLQRIGIERCRLRIPILYKWKSQVQLRLPMACTVLRILHTRTGAVEAVEHSSTDHCTVGRHAYNREPIAKRESPRTLPKVQRQGP
jgi:hypothetical protein